MKQVQFNSPQLIIYPGEQAVTKPVLLNKESECPVETIYFTKASSMGHKLLFSNGSILKVNLTD